MGGDHGRSRTTRKLIALAVVFLVLGAIINVAVAWTCGGLAPLDPNSSSSITALLEAPTPREWIRCSTMYRMQGPGIERVGCWAEFVYYDPENPAVDEMFTPSPSALPGWLPSTLVRTWGTDAWPNSGTTHLAQGWPFATMRCEFFGTAWIKDGIVLTRDPSSQPARLLALRPIYRGFAINTLFYAALLWLLFAAPFALRRWRRIKRGLCPACAYPVGSSDVCTECGTKVASPSIRTPGRAGRTCPTAPLP